MLQLIAVRSGEAVLINDQNDDLPLLHSCISKGIATPKIVRYLIDQADDDWKGVTAVDLGTDFNLTT